jgi:hypothetical protein
MVNPSKRLPARPCYGAGGTSFSTKLNAVEKEGKDGAEDLGSLTYIEGRFDGKRTTGEYTVELLDGRTLPVWKGSGEDLDSAIQGLWPATLTVKWNLGGEEQPTIQIVRPRPDEDQVFRSGKLVIEAEAKVEPGKYEKDVVWEVQDIQGSSKSISPEKGAKVSIAPPRTVSTPESVIPIASTWATAPMGTTRYWPSRRSPVRAGGSRRTSTGPLPDPNRSDGL